MSASTGIELIVAEIHVAQLLTEQRINNTMRNILAHIFTDS